MGKGSGGGGESKTEPWKDLQPYLRGGYGAAQQHVLNRPQYFTPGDTVAGFDQGQEGALNALENRGKQGSDVGRAGQGFLESMLDGQGPGSGVLKETAGGGYVDAYNQGKGAGGADLQRSAGGANVDAYGRGEGAGGAGLQATSRGDFLGNNPYLDDAYGVASKRVTDTFQNEVMPGLNATFSMAGRGGSGGHELYSGEAAGGAADALASLSSDIYGNAYESERDRMLAASGTLNQGHLAERGFQEGAAGQLNQGYLAERGMQGLAGQTLNEQGMQAAGLAPALAGLDYQDISARMQAGNMRQGQRQDELNDQKARFDFAQQEPVNRMNQYMQLLQGNPILTSSGGGPPKRNRAGGAISGAAGGALAGSQIMPGWGTAIGGVIGGLYGGFA